MRLDGERGLMITYDPPGPESPAPSPNQFPVNTQEICYINVIIAEYYNCFNPFSSKLI